MKRFLDVILLNKFDIRIPLAVVIVSMIYTVYRSADFGVQYLNLPLIISWVSAVVLEFSVIGDGALIFAMLREQYVKQLDKEDNGRALFGLFLAMLAMVLLFGILGGVAYEDARARSSDPLAVLLVTANQIVQTIFVVILLIRADLAERSIIRKQREQDKESRLLAKKLASQIDQTPCAYCGKSYGKTNIKRHESTCRCNPGRVK